MCELSFTLIYFTKDLKEAKLFYNICRNYYRAAHRLKYERREFPRTVFLLSLINISQC